MRLKEWRVKHGKTVAEMATALGYKAPSYITEIEMGDKQPSFRFAQAVYELSKGEVNLLGNIK